MPLKYIHDEKVEKSARKVAKRYFGFINPEDVFVVRDIYSMKHRKIATIGPISPMYEPFFPPESAGGLLIVIRDCNWRKLHKNARRMVLYHEYMHIAPEDNEKRLDAGYKYVLVRHDLEEFYALIKTYGVGWLTRRDLPNIMKEKINLERVEEYPEL